MDFIEAGNTKRTPFVLLTKEQVEMLRASQSRSIMVRITQRVATFKKGSVKIVFESAPDSHDPGSTESRNSGSSTSGNTIDTSKLQKKAAKKASSIPVTHEKLKDLLAKTEDVRLTEDGK